MELSNLMLTFNPRGQVTNLCCIENKFYHYLVKKSEKLLNKSSMLLIDNSSVNYPVLPNHIKLSDAVGCSGEYSLYAEIANVSIKYARSLGINLPATALQNNRDQLAAFYFASTGIVVQQTIVKRDGISGFKYVLATRNVDFLRASNIPQKRRDELETHIRGTMPADLMNGKFPAAVFSLDANGFTQPKCGQLNVSAKKSVMLPLFVAISYMNRLVSILQKRPLDITYLNAGGEEICMKTTLNRELLTNRFKREPLEGIGVVNPQSACASICLIDYSGKIHDVNTLSIKDIKQV